MAGLKSGQVLSSNSQPRLQKGYNFTTGKIENEDEEKRQKAARMEQQRQSVVFNNGINNPVNEEIYNIASKGQKNLISDAFKKDVQQKTQQAAMQSKHSFTPTDLGEVKEVSLLGELGKGTIKTANNALVQTGKSLLDFGERVSDSLIQLGSSKLNPFMWISAGFDKNKVESMQNAATDIIKGDSSEATLDTLGYNKVLNNGKTVQETIDEGSLVKSNNLLGKAFRSGGQMLPSLMAPTNALGLALMAGSSYGGGLEEAYNNDADRLTANIYGLLNAGIETGTEALGGMLSDNPFTKGIRNQVSAKISNSVAQKLIELGLDMAEEGFEEILGDILQPFAQKLTYASEEDLIKLYGDQNFLEDFTIAAITAGIMGTGKTVIEIKVENNLQQEVNQKVNGKNKLQLKNELMQMGLSEIKAIKIVNNALVEKGLKTIPTQIEVKENKAKVNNIKLDTNQIDTKLDELNNLAETVTDRESLKRIDTALDTLEVAKQELQKTVKEEVKEESSIKSNLKEQQMKIINDSNPMQDNIHTGIRSVEDIKSAKEVFTQENFDEQSNPDFTLKDAQKALETGEVTVYSSTPIENGNFVTTSKMMAQDYAGNEKVYSQTVPVDSVVWIDNTEGQFAKVETNVKSENETTVEKPEMTQKVNDAKESKKLSDSTNLNEKMSQTRRKIAQLEDQINRGKSIDSNMSPSKLMGLNIQLAQLKNELNELNSQKTTFAEETLSPDELGADIEYVREDTPTKTEESTPKNTIAEKIEDEKIEVRPTQESVHKWSQTATSGDYEGVDFVRDIIDNIENSYVVQNNKSAWNDAEQYFDKNGYDYCTDEVFKTLESDSRLKIHDTMLAQKVLLEAAKKGDADTVYRLVTDMNELATDYGQIIQSVGLIKKMTPEGQLKMLQRAIDKMKRKQISGTEDVQLTDEMINKVLDSTPENLENNVDEVKQLLADQMKGTLMDKFEAWRYFSMLGNPKTHIRNMLSNVTMLGMRAGKKAIQRTIEGVMSKFYKNIPRTISWRKTTKEISNYVDNYDSSSKLGKDSKYSDEGSILANKKAFGKTKVGKLTQSIINFNTSMLENEDMLFKSKAFKSAMKEYLTANGMRTEEDLNNNPTIVSNAAQYATEEALKATFQQYNAAAAAINQFGNSGKFKHFLLDTLLPFRRTPANIAKTTFDYSALGLFKTVTKNSVDLARGRISANTYIDNISQGLTGTGLMIIGMLLANTGILHGKSKDTDKEGQLEKSLGVQDYSIEIGGKTFTLDWLNPVAIPLFMGVDISESGGLSQMFNLSSVVSTGNNFINPLIEMTYLSNIDQFTKDYTNDGPAGIVLDTIGSYLSQYVPTLGGQIAKIIDPTIRTSAPDKDANEIEKVFQSNLRQIMKKIPGLTYLLEPSTDVWGNDLAELDNVVLRSLNILINPSTMRDVKTDPIIKEIDRVYKKTKDNGALPSIPSTYYFSPSKTIEFKHKSYATNAEEYTKIKRQYGNISYKTLKALVETDEYKDANDTDKLKLIKDAYKYANEKTKKTFLATKNVKFTNKKHNKKDVYKDSYIKYLTEDNISKDNAKYRAQNFWE